MLPVKVDAAMKSDSATSASFAMVPPELMEMIFRMLDEKSKVKAEGVCYFWLNRLRDTWNDVTELTVSGAFVGGQMSGNEFKFESDRVEAFLLRCHQILSLNFQIGSIADCDENQSNRRGLQLFQRYSFKLRSVASVNGILAHSTKRAVSLVLTESRQSLIEITLCSFSRDVMHTSGVATMWDYLINLLRHCQMIASVNIELPRSSFQNFLSAIEHKQLQTVHLLYMASNRENVSQKCIDLVEAIAIPSQLRDLSITYNVGIMSITEVFHSFSVRARQTVQRLLISIVQGPKREIVADLLLFLQLGSLTFDRLIWSSNSTRRVRAFVNELFRRSDQLNKELLCRINYTSGMTAARLDDLAVRIIQQHNTEIPDVEIISNESTETEIVLKNDNVTVIIRR